MTVVSCLIDERYVNPLFEVFDGGDLILSSYRDIEDDHTTLQIFLQEPDDAPRAAEALVAAGRIVGVDLQPVVGSLPDEDWKLAYRKHFKIDVVSPRLAIVPEWEVSSFKPIAGQKTLILDPGMAFGTGQHATTRACLNFIDRLATEDADRSFLDDGCGSGILAIAAVLEGFRAVRGFDIDPDAVQNANENAERNGLSLGFFRGDLSGSSRLDDVVSLSPAECFAADVVAANVLGPILIRFAKEIAALVKPGGQLILSGILDELYPEVAAAYAPLGFSETESELIGEWRTGLFRSHVPS